MNLDRALNLVVPVGRNDGTNVYVHATPISREVFDENFLVIAKTFTAIYSQGLGILAGPRIAAKLLRKVAAEMGQGPAVENGLVAEMKRLSNVIVPDERGGWTPLPLQEAISRNVIDLDDADEVENAIAFFMLASAMHKKRESAAILSEAAKLWSAQTTLSNSTVYAASLATSIPPANSGAKAPQSPIAS